MVAQNKGDFSNLFQGQLEAQARKSDTNLPKAEAQKCEEEL